MPLAKQFSQNLPRLRAKRGMTQMQLATEAGVCVSYISHLERGERQPTLDTVEAIAHALQVRAIDLLKG